ncbi:MAG: DinB family protein [Acidimicrobiia bacterium]|nr:DinB family protein [Acidimicrobiia bacterium]
MTNEPPRPAQADDKDWTWVLHRPCEQCGAAVGSLTMGQIVALNRRCGAGWVDVLGGDPRWVRSRPEPDIWSPLEYGCHVRDVFTLFLERLELMLAEDGPTFANWNPNLTAEAERYDLQDPAMVAGQLGVAAENLAGRFESLDAADLGRTGHRSDGASFTIESFARYEIHDPLHHLWDVSGMSMADWTS